MYCSSGRIFIEDEDQCMDCKNYAEGVACPLLSALGLGIVSLEDNLIVTNCGFFEKFERNLHIVRNDEKNNFN